MNQKKQLWYQEFIYVGLLVLVALFFCFFRLGSYGLLEPDEGRYSEIPREMIETGNYTVPYLNYVKYFEKPVLGYWLTALAFKFFGYTEFASRFIPAFCAFFCVLAVYCLGRRMFSDSRIAFLAGLMLVTSFEHFALSRILVLDMTLNFFFCLSLTFFYFGYTAQKRAWVYYFPGYICIGLAVLVKGLIGIVFPFGIVFLFLLFTRDLKRLKKSYLITGILLILAVALPWYIKVCKQDQDFFNFFFIQEHFKRYTSNQHGREGSIFYFVPVLLVGFFPWIVYFPLSIVRYFKLKKWKEAEPHTIFLLVWFFLIFLFFSLSGSKLPAYIIVVYFPLSLLVARLVRDYLVDFEDRSLEKWFRYSSYLLLSLIPAMAIAVFVAVTLDHNLAPAKIDSLKLILYLLVGFGVLFFATLKRKRLLFVVGNFVLISSLLVQVIYTLPKVESFRSAKPLAKIINSQIKTNDAVVFYCCYQQSIIFYTKKRPIIIDWRGELKYGFENTPGVKGIYYYPNKEAIFDLLTGFNRIFCIASHEDYAFLKKKHQYPLYELGHNVKFVLFSNKA